jgi:hypothetical protein
MFRNKELSKEKFLSERGFEPLPSDEDQKSHTPYRGERCHLESGALDHSAILTSDQHIYKKSCNIKYKLAFQQFLDLLSDKDFNEEEKCL